MLVWADDFNTYGSGGIAKVLDGNYAQADRGMGVDTSRLTIVADPDPLADAGTLALKFVNQGYDGNNFTDFTMLRKVLPTAVTTAGMSNRLWLTTLPVDANSCPMFSFCDSNNLRNVNLLVTPVGSISAYRGDKNGGGVLLGTSTVCLTPNAWHHIEVKVKVHATLGTIQIRVNNVVVLNLTSLNTVNSGSATEIAQISLVRFANSLAAVDNYYQKDLVIWDTTGSYNNDFFGPCFVKRYTVDADDSFNWTASTGSTGYNLINEVGPNDANYISGAVGSSASLFTLQDLPIDATAVKGFIIMNRLKKSDGGSATVQAAVDLAGVVSNGADRQPTTAYTYWNDVIEVNTGTGLPFSPTDFNSLKLKLTRTS